MVPGGQRQARGRGQNQAEGEARVFQPTRKGEEGGWEGGGGDAEPLTLKPVYWTSPIQQETIKYSKSLD